MGATGGYKTKQRERILCCLQEHEQRHVTADEVLDTLKAQGEAVGKATVYRYLDRLVEEGMVRKYYLENGQGACFQYAGTSCCREHFHLKCVRCGHLEHLECSHLELIAAHILQSHHFQIDSGRTVFYGRCAACAEDHP